MVKVFMEFTVFWSSEREYNCICTQNMMSHRSPDLEFDAHGIDCFLRQKKIIRLCSEIDTQTHFYFLLCSALSRKIVEFPNSETERLRVHWILNISIEHVGIYFATQCMAALCRGIIKWHFYSSM